MKIGPVTFCRIRIDRTSTKRAALMSAVLGLAALLPLVAAAQPVPPPWRERLPAARPQVEVTIQGATVDATVARSSNEQQLGLGYRDRLEDGTGMLFIYADPSPRSFWMKGMRFCLDIIWIEGDRVVGAAESVCPEAAGTPDGELPSYVSPEPVRYVLEVPAGWIEANGIETGAEVTFDPDPATLLLQVGTQSN
jgi:uncharacterized membrane protein (UPF0127 family)